MFSAGPVWFALLGTLVGCSSGPSEEPTKEPAPVAVAVDPVPLRIATFNVSLYGREALGVAGELADVNWEKGKAIAQILQTTRPDVVLLNELDYDAEGLAAQRLVDGFLAVGQAGNEPLSYPHIYVAPSNTGVSSGFDLNNDGTTTTTPGSTSYGDDSFGFGEYEGQYSFVVLSRFPIATTRTFQRFLWKDMPGATLPDGWYSAEEQQVMRLSSKNHVDLGIQVGTSVVHFLVSHPTPPTFDGDEDRNGLRNADEIKFWKDYIDSSSSGYHVDDDGVAGGLTAGDYFVIAGDLNADPNDGDSRPGAINQLLDHPLVNDTKPTSLGAAEQDGLQGGRNLSHSNPAEQDTADFNDNSVGNLRLDYVLPSTSLTAVDAGVFWPVASDPLFSLVGTYPFPVSDHRHVWQDVLVPQASQ